MADGLSPARRDAQGDGRSHRAGHRASPWCSARCSCRPRSWPASAASSFKQFALTIAASTIISAFNSLTLSPALCAHPAQAARARRARPCARRGAAAAGHRRCIGGLLAYVLPDARVGARCSASTVGGHGDSGARPAIRGAALGAARRSCSLAGGVAGWFAGRARQSACSARSSAASTGSSTARSTATAASVGVLLRLSVDRAAGLRRPDGADRPGLQGRAGRFIPEQDKGYLVVNAQLPDGASLDRTDEVDRSA